MAAYQFSAGTTIAFDPASDVLQFDAAASGLDFLQVGEDLRVYQGAGYTVLANVALASLQDANFSFSSGVAHFDFAGNDSLSGTSEGDYLNASNGGTDEVAASGGDDRII